MLIATGDFDYWIIVEREVLEPINEITWYNARNYSLFFFHFLVYGHKTHIIELGDTLVKKCLVFPY